MSTSAAVARARRRLQLAGLLVVVAIILAAVAFVLSPWLLLPAFVLGVVIAPIVLFYGVTLRATLRGSDTDVRSAVLGLVQGPLSDRMLTRSKRRTSVSIVDRATVQGYVMTVRWRQEEGGIRITVVADTPRAFLNRKTWIAWAADWESVVEGLVGLGYVREA